MKRSHLSICLAMFLLNLAASHGAVYQEIDGRVVVEAENFHSRTNHPTNNHHWHIVPTEDGVDEFADTPASPVGGFQGARGDKYLQILPEGGFNVTSAANFGGPPWVDYKVYIQTTGRYRLYLRARGFDGNSDSMYAEIVELADGPGGVLPDWYRWSPGSGTTFNGTWRGVGAIEDFTIDLAQVNAEWDIRNPGIYTIRVKFREDGVAFDALSFQLTTIAAPTDPGPDESPIAANLPPFVSAILPSSPVGVFPDTVIGADIQDADKQATPSTVVLSFNGTTVTPNVNKSAGVTTVRFTPSALLAAGSVNNVQLIYADNASPAGRYTHNWQFVAEKYATLTASHAAPRASVDTASSGFTVRVAQSKDTAGYPGADLPNNTRRAEDELAGRLPDLANGQPVPNFANPGPGPGGTYPFDLINWNQSGDAGNFQSGSTPPFPDELIPGVPGTDPDSPSNLDNIAAEVVTHLELPAGLHRLGVNSDDGFRVTAAANPRDPAAVQVGIFEGGRGAADSLFSVLAAEAGIYPVRLIWYEGGGGAALEFFSVDIATGQKILINDRSNPKAIKAYRSMTGATRPYASVSPLHNSINVPGSAQINVQIFDQSTAVASGSVRLSLNGAAVTPNIAKSGSVTAVTYDPPGLLAPASKNTVTLVYSDNGSPAATVTNAWEFTVQDYSGFPVIPASYAVPRSSVNLNSSGFSVEVYQMDNGSGAPVARTGFANNNLVEAAELQFARGFIDPATSQPYPNIVPAGPEAGGRYRMEFVNWMQTAPANAGGFNNGNGYPDAEIPGIPAGDTAAQNWIVAEALTYLDLKAGVHQFIVNCDDGFKLSSTPHPRSALSTQLGIRSPGGGGTDVAFNFIVEQAGLYPMRLLWWEGTGGANAEFIVVDMNTGARRLINDRTTYFSVNAYPAYTGPQLPYVTSVKPAQDARVVLTTTPIEATLANVGTSAVTMMLNGTSVTPTLTSTAGTTTVRYPPLSPLPLGSSNTVALTYGGITSTWSFVVQTGPKVVYILGNPAAINSSDRAIIDRFITFGFEVVVLDDIASRTADAEGAVLIAISESVGSGDVNTKFRDVAVPVVIWESALADDFLMTDNAANLGTVAGQTAITITDATHPLAAGLAAGNRTVTTAPATFVWAQPATTAKVIGTLADGSGNPALFGYEKGVLLADGTTAAPARRVLLFQFGDAYAVLNDDGRKLVDAAMGWAMNTAFPPVQSNQPKFNLPAISADNVTITWTGTGRLQESADLRTWTNVAGNPASGFQVTPAAGASKFYRLTR